MCRFRVFLAFPALLMLVSCASSQRANLSIEPIKSLNQTVSFIDGVKYITQHSEDLGLTSTLSIQSYGGKVPSLVLFKLALVNTKQQSITVSVDDIYTYTEKTQFLPVVNAEGFLTIVRREQNWDRFVIATEELSIGLRRSQPAPPSIATTSTRGSVRNGNVRLDSTTILPNSDAERIRNDNLNQRELANQRKESLLDQELESAHDNYFKTHTLRPGEIYEKSFVIDLTRELISGNLADDNHPILLAGRFNNSGDDDFAEPMWWEIYVSAN